MPSVSTVESARSDRLAELETSLPLYLSLLAGSVDTTTFLLCGGVFSAHITGNVVTSTVFLVQGGTPNPIALGAIPIFVIAVALAWFISRPFSANALRLVRLLVLMQAALILLCGLLAWTGAAPSNPHGWRAGLIAGIAITAIAIQYAMLRRVWPVVPSTAVMTGNLTNTVLTFLDDLADRRHPDSAVKGRLLHLLKLLLGFVLGCAAAAAGVAFLGQGAWVVPILFALIIVFITQRN